MPIIRGRVNRRASARAVSLLEIIMSFTILVSVMIPLMSVWVTHARAFNQSQDQAVAGALAQEYMEQTLNVGYQPSSVFNSPPLAVERTLRGVTETSLFNYTIAVSEPANPLHPSVSPPDSPADPMPSHKVVVVVVGWSDTTGNHTVSMESNAGW